MAAIVEIIPYNGHLKAIKKSGEFCYFFFQMLATETPKSLHFFIFKIKISFWRNFTHKQKVVTI
jgi:hypothetical protein